MNKITDIDLNYRQIVRVEIDGHWEPFNLGEVGETLRQCGMVDSYDPETKRVIIEREVDSRFNSKYGNYEPIYRTSSQDIRDFLRDCSWVELNKIFQAVKQ